MLTLAPLTVKTRSNLTILNENFQLRNTLDTYKDKVMCVTGYCAAVNNLPDVQLNNPADWYNAAFIDAYAKSKAHTKLWTDNGILVQLHAIPRNILDYGELFDLSRADILSYAGRILEDPASAAAQKAKELLKKCLSRLYTEVGSHKDAVKSVRGMLVRFREEVRSHEQFFQKLYEDSKDTKKAVDSKLEDLQAKIDGLNADIKKWNRVQIGMYATMGVSAIAIPIALAFGPIGFLVGIILGVGLIAEGITLLAASENIKNDMTELAKKTASLDSYTADAAVLALLIERLKTLTDILDDTIQSLSAVESAWKQLEDNFNTLITRLATAKEKEETGLYQDLVDILNASEKDEEWKKIMEAAKAVDLSGFTVDTTRIYEVRFAS